MRNGVFLLLKQIPVKIGPFCAFLERKKKGDKDNKKQIFPIILEKKKNMMEKLKHIKAIAFDADDTLWALQNYFEEVEHEYCQLLSEFGSEKEISAALLETESKNMADLGYGCKAFTISLVENAVKVSHGKVESNVIAQIVDLGKSLLHLDAKPFISDIRINYEKYFYRNGGVAKTSEKDKIVVEFMTRF